MKYNDDSMLIVELWNQSLVIMHVYSEIGRRMRYLFIVGDSPTRK